jgi:hypothetical protein
VFHRLRRWSARQAGTHATYVPATEHACPCCGEVALTADRPPPGSGGVCIHCYWQDELEGFRHPDRVVPPNGSSLNDLRAFHGQPPLRPR